MECSVCLNLLIEAPSSLFPAKASKKSSEKCKTEKHSSLCCTPCGHIFHRECLLSWFEYRHVRTCPLCRKTVKLEKMYPVYLELDKDVMEKLHTMSSQAMILQTTSPRRKKATSMLSSLKRFFISDPPSPPSSPSSIQPTLPENRSRLQQLQVAVTINCLQRPQSESGGLESSHLLNTAPQSPSTMCDCRCPQHHRPPRSY